VVPADLSVKQEPAMKTNSPASPDHAARKYSRLWTAIAAMIILLCINFFVISFANVVLSFNNSKPAPLEQEFSNAEYGIRLSLPESWKHRGMSPGASAFIMQFASSAETLEMLPEAPSRGAGIIIHSSGENHTIDEEFPGISGMDEINRIHARKLRNIAVIEEPHEFEISGYSASSGVYLYQFKGGGVNSFGQQVIDMYSTDGRKTVVYLTLIARGNELIDIYALCEPDEWDRYRSTLEAIIQSLEISAWQQ
jgi:hypothetical protein